MKGLLYKNFMSSRLHIAALVFMLLTFGSFIILFAFVATNNMNSCSYDIFYDFLSH